MDGTVLEKISLLYGSAEQLQIVSNNAHLMWGVSLVIIAVLVFLYGYNYKKRFLSLLIPFALLFTIIIFSLYLFLNRGFDNFFESVRMIFSFPEFYVHIAMSVITVFGVIIELLIVTGRVRHVLSPLALPLLSAVGVGYLFVIHPRSGAHDPQTMFIHSLIGSTLIFAGIMIIIQRLINNKLYEKIFITFAAISILASGYMLIQFKESTQAYQAYFPVQINKITSLDLKNEGVIYITENGVIPQNIKIKVGGKITFFQVDSSSHHIASGPPSDHIEYPLLNIGFLNQGESRTISFTDTGNFGFYDHLDASNTQLQGKIEVYSE